MLVCVLAAALQPLRLEGRRRRPRTTATRATPSSTSARRRTIRRSSSTAMSHNATGYDEDMNPDLIDGVHDPRETWARNNAKLALRAEAIVRRLDPSRIVYHHSSGNLGSMHTMQLLSRTSSRSRSCPTGSSTGRRRASSRSSPANMARRSPGTGRCTAAGTRASGPFGSARVPWEFCLAEWNAQFLGDRAFQISEVEKSNLRWEAKQFRAGKLWHRWDYPYELGSQRLRRPARGDRPCTSPTTGGPSAPGASRRSRPGSTGTSGGCATASTSAARSSPVDWENLQRPGFSPDYIDQPLRAHGPGLRARRLDPDRGRRRRCLRNNRPLLAYIGGKPRSFTSKDHNFRPGETRREAAHRHQQLAARP